MDAQPQDKDLPDCLSSQNQQSLGHTSLGHTKVEPPISLSDKQLQRVATMLKALADVNRLQLLLFLQQCRQPICVTQIVEQMNEKITTVSSRLKQLYEADLVSKQREGQHILYSLQDEHVENLLANLIAHASHEHHFK